MDARPLRLLLLAGSARRGAWSVRLRDAARHLADAAGASTSVIDLRALALQVYDADVEAARPESACAALKCGA